MSIDLPEHFKNYAKGHVTLLQNEYVNQMLVWEKYLDTVADAQSKALERHKAVLAAKEDEWLVGLAMLALSFVGGQALGFLGSAVTKHLAGRYRGQLADAFVFGAYEVSNKYSAKYTEVASTLWGDATKTVVQHGVDKVFEKVRQPKDGTETPTHMEHDGLESALMGSSLTSFKTQLKNAFRTASQVVKGHLSLVHANINQSMGFGYDLLKTLNENPAAGKQSSQTQKTFNLPPGVKANSEDARLLQIAHRGKALLDDYFNKLREKYAEKWFYYGHDPENISQSMLIMAIEVEIWKLWVLGQEFKIKYSPENLLTPDRRAEGKDFRRLNQPILKHLYDNLHEATLWNLYRKIYNQTVSTDIESEADLAVVTNWAKNRHVHTHIKARRRKLPLITEPHKIFNKPSGTE